MKKHPDKKIFMTDLMYYHRLLRKEWLPMPDCIFDEKLYQKILKHKQLIIECLEGTVQYDKTAATREELCLLLQKSKHMGMWYTGTVDFNLVKICIFEL